MVDVIVWMNYLYGLYFKFGKIINDDLFYIFSVFIIELILWINCFEWCQVIDFEICVFGIFWKSIGDVMSIDYSDFKYDFWDSGIVFYYDIKDWVQYYEVRVMKLCQMNKIMVDEFVIFFLYYIFCLMLGFVCEVIGVFMGD